MKLARAAALVAVPAAILLPGCSIGTPEPATYVTDTSATLNGVVYSNEQPGEITYWFRWGTTTAYGNTTPERTLQIPAGAPDDRPYPVSEPLGGLEPNTTYHYQVCTAPPRQGCVDQDESFTTGPAGSGRSGIAFSSLRAPEENYEVYVMDADGSDQTNLTDNPADDRFPAWSPDAGKLAFESDRDDTSGDLIKEIYVMDTDGSDQTRLTNDPASDADPAWSPDGSKIAFEAERDGNNEIYVMDADGSDQTNLTNDAADDQNPVWSPDGSRLAFQSDRDGNDEIYVMDADGSDQTRLTTDAADDEDPAWSPDGSKIAFEAERDGSNEIYVMDADGSDQTRLTDNSVVDQDPVWSPDGGKIAFGSDSEGDLYREIWVMDADGTDQALLAGAPEEDYANPAWSPRLEPSTPTLGLR